MSAEEHIGGGRGIRTHDGCNPIAVFKTAALGHYASPPGLATQRSPDRGQRYRHVVDGYHREGETKAERLDRNSDELHQELRVTRPGVQILTPASR